MMPMQTSTKANRVPMFVSSPRTPMRQKPGDERHDDAGDDRRDVRASGTWGGSSRRASGSRPSRAIEKKMRGWPSSITRITDDQAGDRAELDERTASQACPIAAMATAIGSGDVELLVGDHAGQHGDTTM